MEVRQYCVELHQIGCHPAEHSYQMDFLLPDDFNVRKAVVSLLTKSYGRSRFFHEFAIHGLNCALVSLLASTWTGHWIELFLYGHKLLRSF